MDKLKNFLTWHLMNIKMGTNFLERAILYFSYQITRNQKILNKVFYGFLKQRKIWFKLQDIGIIRDIIIYNVYAPITQKIVKCNRPIVFDVGAHVGIFSLFILEKNPNSIIFAIEPEKTNFELLRKNIKNLKNVKTLKYAITDKISKINLFLSPLSYAHTIVDRGNVGRKTQLVRSVTINYLLKKFKVKKIDFMKIDVESAEELVLKGCKGSLNKINFLMIEIHDEKSIPVLIKLLGKKYSIKIEERKGERILVASK